MSLFKKILFQNLLLISSLTIYTPDWDERFKISVKISSHLSSGPSLGYVPSLASAGAFILPFIIRTNSAGSVGKLLVYLCIYFHHCLHMIPSISFSVPVPPNDISDRSRFPCFSCKSSLLCRHLKVQSSLSQLCDITPSSRLVPSPSWEEGAWGVFFTLALVRCHSPSLFLL